ncbi:molybdate ABC transporter substrate-binding protein [Colwellia sp. 1_MG-2023]|uniref:molybdate ABC transporter substrate-binding protein n=1 Tax=Colwellia sp. 1_MG-2023 TaxID=3062649 RepID=UPI0026E1258A|nr:molybdate ABC transporter substrate-binding protein [Colwellia sp. 1_MG-2023]MDO6446535.1 molybdate ABC transporter substrate-binding protein [Colwellia sp. 1_MG-2023]
MTKVNICSITLFFLALVTSQALFAKGSSAPSSKILNIAVSANFAPALKKLLPQFEQQTGINTQVFIGSTGNLFQQIHHGAPFDIFIAADKLRPSKLVKAKLALGNSLKTYAFGTISFWSSTWQHDNQASNNSLTFENLLQDIPRKRLRIAIANPTIAPYGVAAKQLLEATKLWQMVDKKQLIMGSNINQTFQQVRSGAVPLGIVADSQLILNDLAGIKIPRQYYQAIEQQLVILSASKKVSQSQLLSDYLLSNEVQQIIATLGYQAVTPLMNLKRSDND